MFQIANEMQKELYQSNAEGSLIFETCHMYIV